MELNLKKNFFRIRFLKRYRFRNFKKTFRRKRQCNIKWKKKILQFKKINSKINLKKFFYISGDISKESTLNKLMTLLKNKLKLNGIIANAGELKKSYDFRDIRDFQWYLNKNFYTSYNLFLKFVNELKK